MGLIWAKKHVERKVCFTQQCYTQWYVLHMKAELKNVFAEVYGLLLSVANWQKKAI